MSALRLVAAREVRERVRAKSFYVLTGLLVAGILVVGVIARLADDGPSTVDVGIVGGETALIGAVEQAARDVGIEIDVHGVDPDRAVLVGALESGDLDVVLVPDRAELLFDAEVDERVAATLQLAWSSMRLEQALVDAGLDAAAIAQVLDPAPLAVQTVGGTDDEEISGVAALAGSATAIMLFISLQTFGGYVLMGVVEEKASAVVEVLLVRIRPVDLLAGKVIGIGIAALLQFAAAVAAGIAAFLISGADLPSDVLTALPISVVWFLGGYALYSTLFALAGSLVSRQEDAQAANAPIMVVLVLAYMTIFVFGYVPKSAPARILSVIPPFAPFEMPLRMAAGAASVVEIVTALVLLVVAIVAAAILASRIYAQVLLRRGTRIGWSEALALARRRP